MRKIRKRLSKFPRAGKAKRFPSRVTFLAGGDFRARSNIPENEGLLEVVEQPGTGCPRLSRVAIFPLALLSLKNRRQSVSG